MAASMKRKVIKTALVSRVLIIVLQIVFNNLIPDHDADAFHYKSAQKSSFGDKIVNFFFGGFGKWDGAHFLSIAENGYIKERQYAFFPLLPMMMSMVANTVLLPLQWILSMYSRLLLAASVINVISFTLAAYGIYILSELVLNDAKLAYNSALLFCINPASVFFSSTYTETLFAALTFYGMILIEQGWYATSALTFALSTLTRSNGMVSCGFVLYKMTWQTIHYISIKHHFSIFKLILTCCKNGFIILLSIAAIVLPFFVYQCYGFLNFCTDYDNILKFLTDYISGKNIAIRTSAPSWCDDRPPLLYSYIQNHYWDVGFLKYYQLKKIPNFILAFPMVVICICAVWTYSWKNWNTVKFLEFRKRTSVTIGYMSEAVFVYIVHLCTLVVFATTCINIEVTTRLICSCCPAFYWYVASVIKSKGHLKRKALAKDGHNTISTFYKHFAIDDFNTKLILIYFLSYCVVGVLLHCNFLPWT